MDHSFPFIIIFTPIFFNFFYRSGFLWSNHLVSVYRYTNYKSGENNDKVAVFLSKSLENGVALGVILLALSYSITNSEG